MAAMATPPLALHTWTLDTTPLSEVLRIARAVGWNAVAVGTAGRPGLGLKAADEQTAVNSALADCAKRDSDCHVIAIGPFMVGPTN